MNVVIWLLGVAGGAALEAMLFFLIRDTFRTWREADGLERSLACYGIFCMLLLPTIALHMLTV